MVLCKCGCGKEIIIKPYIIYANKSIPKYIRGHNNRNTTRTLTSEHIYNLKISHMGKISPTRGKKMSDEFCKKNSESHKGQIPWNKGKKGLQIAWNKGKCGKNSPTWKGGSKLANSKSINKRNRELGFNPINEYYINLEGHHVNKTDIIYIPKEWNHIVYHNVHTGKNMFIVNSYAYFFMLQQNIQKLHSYFSEMKG